MAKAKRKVAGKGPSGAEQRAAIAGVSPLVIKDILAKGDNLVSQDPLPLLKGRNDLETVLSGVIGTDEPDGPAPLPPATSPATGPEYDPAVGPMPAGLRRVKDPNAPPVDLKVVMGTGRDWVMPDPNRVRVEAPIPIFVDNREAPVTVGYIKPKKRVVKPIVAKGKKAPPAPPPEKDEIVIIRTFSNMDEFEAEHDFKSYPVKAGMTQASKTLTMIYVAPKPWAGKIDVPGINDDASPPTAAQERKVKVARSFSQPDAPGKAVADGSSLGAILRLMLTGTKTMDQIVTESGVEGGVLSAEDKVLHRIKFVLFRQHGVGHVVDGKGLVSAVLPSGFDAKTMFKAAKGGK